jgi:hypothetical protein
LGLRELARLYHPKGMITPSPERQTSQIQQFFRRFESKAYGSYMGEVYDLNKRRSYTGTSL